MSKEIIHLFVYGTLMSKYRHALYPGLQYVKEASVKGTLVDLTSYPGYLPNGDTVIKGELLEIKDPKALKGLDAYEGYHEDNPLNSLYIRSVTKTNEGDLCYIYNYNCPLQSDRVIGSGDWMKRHS